jgi:hypothetical protein
VGHPLRLLVTHGRGVLDCRALGARADGEPRGHSPEVLGRYREYIRIREISQAWHFEFLTFEAAFGMNTELSLEYNKRNLS